MQHVAGGCQHPEKKVKVKRDKILKRYVLIWPICLVKQRRKICILCLRVVFCLDFIYLCLPCCKTHRTPLHNIPPKTPCAPFIHELCFSCWAVGASIGYYPYQKWSSIKAHNITGRCAYWFFFFLFLPFYLIFLLCCTKTCIHKIHNLISCTQNEMMCTTSQIN